jgi:hypothetical protein
VSAGLLRLNLSSMTIALRHRNSTSGCVGCRLSPRQRVTYAAQRINSARNGMTSKFGWLQAPAIKKSSLFGNFYEPRNYPN